jgi:hypothetical protein
MYDLEFAQDVLEELGAIDSPGERRKFLAAVQCLPADPAHPGLAETLDQQGRVSRISVISGVSFVYWPDHAMRKIRVLAVRSVQD